TARISSPPVRTRVRMVCSALWTFTFLFDSPVPPLDLHSFPTRRSSDLLARDTRSRGFQLVAASAANALLADSSAGGRRQEYLRRSEEHTSELQSRFDLVCRLLLEKKKFVYCFVLFCHLSCTLLLSSLSQ